MSSVVEDIADVIVVVIGFWLLMGMAKIITSISGMPFKEVMDYFVILLLLETNWSLRRRLK